MMLSRACQYGIRAALFLATRPDAAYVPVREISSGLGISHHFLAKILQQLTAQAVLRSYRGPNGGVTLAKPADQIAVLDIVTAIDGSDVFDQCVLGLPGCGEKKPCPLHDEWGSARDHFGRALADTSLGSMADRMIREGHRLTSDGTLLESNYRP